MSRGVDKTNQYNLRPTDDRSPIDSAKSLDLSGVTARDRSECSPYAIAAWAAVRLIHTRSRLSSTLISAVDIVAEKTDGAVDEYRHYSARMHARGWEHSPFLIAKIARARVGTSWSIRRQHRVEGDQARR